MTDEQPQTPSSESSTAGQFSPGFHAGMPPGRAVYTGPRRDFVPTIQVFNWTSDSLHESHPKTVDEAEARADATTTWMNVTGIHDVAFLKRVTTAFGVHPLTLEDIMHPGQRPKVELFPDHTFIVLKMVHLDEADRVQLEQVSLVVGPGFVITFQQDTGDVFDGIRDRLRSGLGRVRERKQDYFAYALMDAIVDGYVEAVSRIGEVVETAERDLDADDTERIDGLPQRLHDHKRELMTLRKVTLPLRDAIGIMLLNEGKRITKRNIPYYRDLHDHLVQVVDSVEMYREMIANLVNLHMGLVGQRTNEEMRVLTVIATIFIPLTFLVGVYGMNFDSMPELHQPWAYPALWVVMVGVAGGLLLYFRRRGML